MELKQNKLESIAAEGYSALQETEHYSFYNNAVEDSLNRSQKLWEEAYNKSVVVMRAYPGNTALQAIHDKIFGRLVKAKESLTNFYKQQAEMAKKMNDYLNSMEDNNNGK